MQLRCQPPFERPMLCSPFDLRAPADKLCATFHISLAVPSICSRFLSCKVMHTKIDNLKSRVACGESASSARFFDILF